MDEKTDRDGNRIYRKEGALWLKLKREEKPRFLGRVHGGLLDVQRDLECHYYRLQRGWAFNASLFEDAGFFGFSRVRFRSKFKRVDVTVSVEAMLKNFRSMPKYSKEGFEKQKFLPEIFFGVKPEPETVRTPPIKTKKELRAEKRADKRQLTMF